MAYLTTIIINKDVIIVITIIVISTESISIGSYWVH